MRQILYLVWIFLVTMRRSRNSAMTIQRLNSDKEFKFLETAKGAFIASSAYFRSAFKGEGQNPEIGTIVNVTHGSDPATYKIYKKPGKVGESRLEVKQLYPWDSLEGSDILVEHKNGIKIQVIPNIAEPAQHFTATPLMYLLIPLVLLNKCAFGCKVNLETLVNIWNQPHPVVIGAVVQFVLMPLCGFLLTRLVQLTEPLSLGFIIACSCPGGGGGYLYALLLEGNVTLSITMTFTSTVLAVFLMPLSLSVFSAILGMSRDLYIPFYTIGSTLLSIVVPMSLGIYFKHKFSKIAKIFERIIKPFSIVIITGGFYLGLKMGSTFLQSADPKLFLIGLLVPAFGLFTGYFAASIYKLPLPVCKTVAIESGVQNTLIALVMLQFSFSQPEADLSSAAPFIVALSAAYEMILLLIFYNCRKRCQTNKL
ncbi:sodium/bile acid cotransporter 5-like [Heterodontus francisci]|uniref:sodium/bile acid cotransporter 5-like n=1 Tax=Heterodontus francisci TaxID=7792 RepID=UPI00355BE000